VKTKAAAPKWKVRAPLEQLQQRYAKLRTEHSRLREQLAKVRAERDESLRAVGTLMARAQLPVTFGKEALFAQMGKHQSIEELIAELAAEAH
jgi:hypothetical protein